MRALSNPASLEAMINKMAQQFDLSSPATVHEVADMLSTLSDTLSESVPRPENALHTTIPYRSTSRKRLQRKFG